MSTEEIKKVEEENKQLKNQKVCTICKDRIRSRMFLPCTHILTCDLCFMAFTVCPKCKHIIRQYVTVYI